MADTLPDGWQCWLDWHREVAPANATEIEAVQEDRGRYLGYVRVVGSRRPGVLLEEPIGSIPENYSSRPLLRDPVGEAAASPM